MPIHSVDLEFFVLPSLTTNGKSDSQENLSSRLLVALPALNEEATITRVVEAVPRELASVGHVQILVIDDGSTDRTLSLAGDAGAYVIQHARSCGVGAAFRTALTYALHEGVDLLVTIDADGQFDPCDIPKLIAPVINDDADFSTASRFKDRALTPRNMSWVKRWGNRQMSRLISQLTNKRFYDVSCGMRCYNRRAMLNLNLMGAYTYTQEVFLNLAFKGMRIVEVPIKVRGEREFGTSRVVGSLWGYAFRALRIIVGAYRDHHPIRFFGGIAALFLFLACSLGFFFLAHYLHTGAFTPHKWAGVTSAVLVLFSILVLHIGMIADMLNRHRVYLEELLLYTRLSGFSKSGHQNQESRNLSNWIEPNYRVGDQPRVDIEHQPLEQPDTPAHTE